jgi:hypothetical protein
MWFAHIRLLWYKAHLCSWPIRPHSNIGCHYLVANGAHGLGHAHHQLAQLGVWGRVDQELSQAVANLQGRTAGTKGPRSLEVFAGGSLWVGSNVMQLQRGQQLG